MTRFLTFAVAATLAACVGATAWSQGGQSGGVGTSGSAGASGTAGTAGATGTSGGAANAQGTGGTSTAGQAGTGQLPNGTNAPGQRQFGQVQQPGFNFNGPSRMPWFNDQGARQQLNMNDQQFIQLNRSYQDAWNRYNQGTTNLGNNLNEQQRMRQIQQMEAQFNQQFGQTLDTTFTDPRHRQRFNQLNNQFYGYNTLNDPAVRQQLNITPQQQRQLRRMSAAWQQQMQRLQRAGNDNPELTQKQFAALQQRNMQQINSVLTPEQQQNWSQLTGQPHNFPAGVYFGSPASPDTVFDDPSINRGGAGVGGTGAGSAAQGTQGQGTVR